MKTVSFPANAPRTLVIGSGEVLAHRGNALDRMVPPTVGWQLLVNTEIEGRSVPIVGGGVAQIVE